MMAQPESAIAKAAMLANRIDIRDFFIEAQPDPVIKHTRSHGKGAVTYG
ncbi:MAG: hypothetical protein ABW184_10125 [Sphingobium sp.]